MTTIAWDGKTLAADRKISAGSINAGETTKIIKLKDGRLAAAAGITSIAEALLKWAAKGLKEKDKPVFDKDEGYEMFVVNLDKTLTSYDTAGCHTFSAKKYAIGTGWQCALGAMMFGATAEEAVRVAAMLDNNTGDKVDVLTPGK